MKRKLFILSLACSLLLSGCGWMDGSYVSITDHLEQGQQPLYTDLAASSNLELKDILAQMVRRGTPEGLIYLSD